MEKTISINCWSLSWPKCGWILCSICQQPENSDTPDGQQHWGKSEEKFVNVPYCNMVDSTEQAKTHKFGTINSIYPV